MVFVGEKWLKSMPQMYIPLMWFDCMTLHSAVIQSGCTQDSLYVAMAADEYA